MTRQNVTGRGGPGSRRHGREDGKDGKNGKDEKDNGKDDRKAMLGGGGRHGSRDRALHSGRQGRGHRNGHREL